jgi:zinc transporter, ZIP family
MIDALNLFFLTFATGIAMLVGALFATVKLFSSKWLESEFRHGMIAFGGGILISAVALVLVPQGIQHITLFPTLISFTLGGIFFMGIDVYLSRENEKASQLLAMLLDFIPEVMALGALFLLNRKEAFLLAFMIVFQNLPEGFNAYLELRQNKKIKPKTILWSFFGMSFFGPIFGLFGYFFLTEYRLLVSMTMLFASGGVLYLIFQDIAPMSKIHRRWIPALGAVLGFAVGIFGKMVIEH